MLLSDGLPRRIRKILKIWTRFLGESNPVHGRGERESVRGRGFVSVGRFGYIVDIVDRGKSRGMRRSGNNHISRSGENGR
jgi:hypothetical protein